MNKSQLIIYCYLRDIPAREASNMIRATGRVCSIEEVSWFYADIIMYQRRNIKLREEYKKFGVEKIEVCY